nr:single-stranded DNA-binding protein [uncultured Lachnoanaerobaculum sp.]
MSYREMKTILEQMAKENYEDFVKALISFEKGINDKVALDKLYTKYVENDNMSLLNDEFDYMIDELRENGQFREIKTVEKDYDDLVNIVGNVVGEVDVVERENKNGETFKVVNFSVVSKNDEGNKVYHNCSAYGEKSDIPKDFKQGDFVKLFGQIRTSVDDNGKEHTNVRILSSKLLKAKEQMQDYGKENEKIKSDIKALKEEIKERKQDLYYADSFEQSAQIRKDIENIEKKLAYMEKKLYIGQEKSMDKGLVKGKYENSRKNSVLGAIEKYKSEEKEKVNNAKKLIQQNER